MFYHVPFQSSILSSRLVRQTTMRVGLSTQSYPFPSPTGIADFSLRVPGDAYVTSAIARLGPYESIAAEVDSQIPVTSGRFSLGMGVSGARPVNDNGNRSYNWAAAAIGRLRFENVELIPFVDRSRTYSAETGPGLVVRSNFFPPNFKRGNPIGEPWYVTNPSNLSYGMISSAGWKRWLLRTSMIRSQRTRGEVIQLFYDNIQPDGMSSPYGVIFPPANAGSNSGEIRLSRSFIDGPRRHTLHTSARGRTTAQDGGGTTRVSLLPGPFTATNRIPRPSGYTWRPTSKDKSELGYLGMIYEARWTDVGEFSAGLQRVFYHRSTEIPVAEDGESNWLYNTTLSVFPTDRLALYGSYTRGFEESRTAPPDATNANEGVPATLTWQVDAGLRYLLTPSLRLVAGVFRIEKPLFDVGPDNIYGGVGTTNHSGIEFSVTGQVTEGVRIVVGGVLLRARVSGTLVDSGVVGRIPPGKTPVTGTFNVEYGPQAWRGFSVDTRISYESAFQMDRRNTFRSPAEILADAGVRYRFTSDGTPITIRAQVLNVLNTYKWRLFSNPSLYNFTPRRRFTLQVAADF